MKNMGCITIDGIIEILKVFDHSHLLQSIQVNLPREDDLSIFFTNKEGVFTQRIVHFPERQTIDHPLMPLPKKSSSVRPPHWNGRRCDKKHA
jgi:hypothetical protein